MNRSAYDDRDGLIWIDGHMVPWRDARVHLLTHALHYASSAFEGERAYGGEIFKLTEHSQRLHKSANDMGFEIPWSIADIDQACKDILQANSIEDGYVRPIAWRGSEMMGVSAQQNTIHLGIAAWPWPSYFSPKARTSGIKLKTSVWRRPSPETAPVHAKAAGLYMICTMSKHQAEYEGYDDALMLDYRGRIAEATGANIFLLIDNKLHTPIPDCFLDGITRRTVIELAKNRGIEVVEGIIMPADLALAKEVFLTGTAAEVTPVGVIDDMNFNVGDVTHLMMQDYENLVRSNKER